MTGHLRLIRSDEDANDPAADLILSSDDFSVKVSSRVDARFWVRIERDNGKTSAVTDFTPGERPESELLAAFQLAMRSVGSSSPRMLVFKDLVPGEDQTAEFASQVVRVADRVKRLCSAWASETNTEIVHFEMQPRRGKIDALVSFK